MNVLKAKNKQGFTIIEVVLVLAIAALIFLMVFIALPALQRNQRDTARKNQIGKVLAAVTSYQSNNRGKSPVAGNGSWADASAFAKYLDGNVETGGQITLEGEYTVSPAAKPSQPSVPSGTSTDNMVLIMGVKCGDNGKADLSAGSDRQAAVFMKLENGDADYCQAS